MRSDKMAVCPDALNENECQQLALIHYIRMSIYLEISNNMIITICYYDSRDEGNIFSLLAMFRGHTNATNLSLLYCIYIRKPDKRVNLSSENVFSIANTSWDVTDVWPPDDTITR